MLLELFAAVAVGFGVGGLVHLAGKVLRLGLPGWSIPAGAGIGMLGFAIWMEYSWFDRVTSDLPDEVVVASRNAETAWFRPWTFVAPLTNRLIAIDHRFTRRHEAFPDLVLTAVVLMGRFEPGRQIPVVFDCAQNLRADLSAEVRFAEDGSLEGATWLRLPAGDPLMNAACGRV